MPPQHHLALLLALAACEAQPAPTPAPTPAAPPTAPAAAPATTHAAWAGRWTGPEGLFVEITPTTPGRYTLTMQSDLDTLGTYPGEDAAGGIAFTRAGARHLLRATTGDQTGLKYLAGKPNCLMVQPGEGFCR